MPAAARDKGFTLLLVVIALTVLSLVVAACVDAARRFGDEAWAGAERVRLAAALDAAEATTALDLAEAGAAPPQILSRARTMAVGDIAVTTHVRSEAAKIDLNGASPETLRSLLAASGLRAVLAAELSDEIADWRDADNDARLHGAEASEYLAAGRSYTPPNRKFQSVSELGLLLDGGDDLVACLAPDVTVFTGQSDAVADGASARVARALQATPSAHGALSYSIVGGRIVEPGAIFEFDVSAVGKQAHMSRRTVVRMTGNPVRPVWILSETAPIPSAHDASAACARLNRRSRP